MLGEGEKLIGVIPAQHRFISVTNRRIFLHEFGGNFSVIRTSCVESVEVTYGQGAERFVKLLFGGISRGFPVPNDLALNVLLSGLGAA
jgi:hypothetical protein